MDATNTKTLKKDTQWITGLTCVSHFRVGEFHSHSGAVCICVGKKKKKKEEFSLDFDLNPDVKTLLLF